MKTLVQKHDDLRQTCMRVARHMKMVAAQDRKEAAFAETKALKDFWITSAAHLEGEAETLEKAAEEI